MSDERRLTLRKSDWLDDWYCIEWAEHAHTEGLVAIPGGYSFTHSGRVGDADVEGTAEEMLAIAGAIERRQRVGFKRCAVSFDGDSANLCSPRNSINGEDVTLAQLDGLVAEIRRVLAEAANGE